MPKDTNVAHKACLKSMVLFTQPGQPLGPSRAAEYDPEGAVVETVQSKEGNVVDRAWGWGGGGEGEQGEELPRHHPSAAQPRPPTAALCLTRVSSAIYCEGQPLATNGVSVRQVVR